MAVPDTQKGWTYSEYGAKEVLKLEEIAVPSIAANEVLVKVHAAALNPVDSKRRSGKFKATDSPLPVSSSKLMAPVVGVSIIAVKCFKHLHC